MSITSAATRSGRSQPCTPSQRRRYIASRQVSETPIQPHLQACIIEIITTSPSTALVTNPMAASPGPVPSPGRHVSRLQKLNAPVPVLLRPVLRAFILGYGSAVAPRILTLVLQHGSSLRQKHKTKGSIDACCEPREPFLLALQRLLRGGFDLQRFPTFCAALVGGTTLFEVSHTFGALLYPHSAFVFY